MNIAVIEAFNKLCSKPKKFCALCDLKLGAPTKEESNEFRGRVWISWASFRHPKFKSKKYNLCGDCYGKILRRNSLQIE